MTLNLGEIRASVVIDSSGVRAGLAEATQEIQSAAKSMNAEVNVAPKGGKELDAAAKSTSELGRELDRAAGAAGKMNVAPKGAKELDAAGRAADNLTEGLGKAASAAGKITAPKAVTTDLQAADKAAQQLAKGLGDAEKVAPKISVPVAPQLKEGARSAHELANELQRAKAAAADIGAGGGEVKRMDGALGGLMSTAKGLVPQLTAAATAGTILTKGFSRLTAIDSAQGKLRGLGHDVVGVSEIMGSALESVSGTAYGLGDAASAAANAVASGVQPGAELTQVLTTMADTAAISGASLGDMGMIFNSVMAKGKLQGDDLLQLMGRGVPVLQMIADHLGITAQEVSELATEGQISFEIFEAAMRGGVGGAAQEMGDTIVGAMMNSGAAVGRLGEALLQVVGTDGPQAIAGFTASIDLMTDGVKAAYGAWEMVPEPLKAVVGAMVAARIAQVALNTELGNAAKLKVANTFMDAASGISNFGSSLKEAYEYARAANPQMGALGAGFTVVAGQGGVAATAMDGVKGAAGGLLAALGGPWGLALGGASVALGLFMQQVMETKQAQKEAEASTQEWADVLTQAGGKFNEQVQSHALAEVRARELGDTLAQLGISTADAAAATLDLDGAYGVLMSELDQIIAAGTKLEGDSRVGQKLVRSEDAEAAIRLKEELTALHGEQAAGAEAARDAADANTELGRKVAEAHRAAENSTGGFDVLRQMFAGVADDAKSVDEAIENLANAMLGLSDDPGLRLQGYLGAAAEDLQKLQEQLGGGKGGFNVETGMFDHMNEQGRDLHNTVMGLRTSMYEAAAAQYELAQAQGATGVEAAAAAAEAAGGFTDVLVEQLEAAGFTQAEIDALVEKYAMVPGDIMTHINVEGVEAANDLIQAIDERLAHIDTETHTITVDADAITMTKEEAERLGYVWEDIGNNTIQLKADDEMARNAIEEMAARTEHLNTQDNAIVFRGETEQLVADLNEVEGVKAELVTNPAELPVVADTEEARRGIEELGLEAERLPDGNLWVNSNSPEEMQKLLDLGATTAALPSGFVDISSTSPEVISALETVGFKTTTLPDGRVVITDNAKAVRDNIDTNLSQRILNRSGRITLSIIENVSRVFRRAEGGSIPERATGGTIPKLAGGDQTHGGYRLPTTGPGTDTTDGILGVDFRGIPTAWVDAGEYVTNRAATAKWLRTLAAINQDDPRAVLAALMHDLPALANGGVLSAAEIKAALADMNNGAYSMGAFSVRATDCSAAVSATVNTAVGLDRFDSRTATPSMGSWLAAKGFQTGRGDDDDIVVGWYDYGGGANGHTSMRLQDGTYIESGGNTGQGMTIGGKAGGLDGRGYTHFMHLPYDSTKESGGGFLTGEDGAVTSMGTRVSGGVQHRAEFQGIDKVDGASGVGSTFGGGFNFPGLASNASNVSIGQSVGGAGQAAALARQHGYGAQADQVMATRNPFVGTGTYADMLGGPAVAQLESLARQLEAQLGRGGIAAAVEGALNANTPNWDVWLRVSPETVEAFNRLGEAKADRENAVYAIADAERDLAEARKELGEVTEGDVELSTSMSRKLADAEEAVAKARAGGKADKIADAEKKLARAREDAQAELEKSGAKNAEEAIKASENVAKAEAKLTQEREKEAQAIAELQAAQTQFTIAMAVAPVDALLKVADTVVAGISKMAAAFHRLDAVIQSTNEVVVRQQEAQIGAAEAHRSAFTAGQGVVRQERAAREQRHQDVLAMQQAEFDLGVARWEAARTAGAAEVDLSAVRQQGIWDVYQVSSVADQQALVAASQVATMESALAVARARAAFNEQQMAYESAMAQLDLEFAQRNAELQARALGIATRELAAVQGEAAGIAGYGASALAKKTEGTATKAGGIMGLLGSIAKGGIGLALAAPTGGASLLLTAQAVAEGIGHVGSISRGDAQEKAWAEEAQREFDALPDDVKAMIVAQQAGIPIAAAAGALMGAAGGSRDDVQLVQESVQGAFSVGLDVAIAKAEAELAAAEAQRQREERELAVQERQNKLDELNARLALDQEAFSAENYLAELLAVAQEQHAELQQENRQLGEIAGHLAPKNQSVLMSIGGSGWGTGQGGLAEEIQSGFGGISKGLVGEWTSLNVEDRWLDTEKRRGVLPWLPSEEEWLAGGVLKDLPQTVADKLYEKEVRLPAATAPRVSAEAQAEAQTQALVDGLGRYLAGVLTAGSAGAKVDTQFTGDVTIQGRDADRTINALAEHLARA